MLCMNVVFLQQQEPGVALLLALLVVFKQLVTHHGLWSGNLGGSSLRFIGHLIEKLHLFWFEKCLKMPKIK